MSHGLRLITIGVVASALLTIMPGRVRSRMEGPPQSPSTLVPQEGDQGMNVVDLPISQLNGTQTNWSLR